MEFRILGSLEVLEEGLPLPLAGRIQRRLLGILLLNANRPLSSEQLLEALWGPQRPKSGAKALQMHVSQLRRTLGDGRVVTREPGYLLRLVQGELDAQRFEEGVREARGATPEEAVRLLEEGLALWRGPALVDLAEERFARAEIVRLEELRMEAQEERLEAGLALGRHAALVGEIEALIAEQPLRERLRGQLMLALYRCGRQSEALAAYRAGRAALVEELGIEPGRELQRLEQAILRQDDSLALPAAPAAEPVAAPSTTARPRAVPDERKLATILFADLVGSTELAEGDPERVRVFLERFYEGMADEVRAAGGTVEKFIGDAVMAAFGAPVACEDHAERALRAAVAMRRRLAELFDDAVKLRVGVNTGEVVVGRPHAGGSFVSGDAVNVAARLEQAADPGEILVGERTAALAGHAFELGEWVAIEAKGKPQGIRCRRLSAAMPAAAGRNARGLARVFLGRGEQLEALVGAYRRTVAEERAQLVTVVGEPGIGKTTLIRELQRRLETEEPEAAVRLGRCLPYGRGTSYEPVAGVLRERLGLRGDESPDQVRPRLAGREVLGLALGLEPADDLHPLMTRERLHQAWVELVEELVSERPLVLALEDAHWADEPLLDLLARLQLEVRGPLLLLVTARPELLERRPALGAGRRGGVVWLDPLTAADTERMLASLLPIALVPRLQRLVLERAEGNPFFVEELLGTLIDRGVIARSGESWVVHEPPADFVVPDTLQSVLAARIDLLEPADKETLQAAAVVGRTFWAGPVGELVAGHEVDFGRLEERDFIRRRPRSSISAEHEFTFKHALTREVAHATIPKAKRAHLHAAVAGWLEEFGDGRDEHAAALAHHYAEAVRPADADLAWSGEEAQAERLRAKARTWLSRAAELARTGYALEEEIGFLRKAVELASTTTERVRIWGEIAHACALNYDDGGFREAILAAIDATDDAGKRAELIAEAAFQSAVRWQREVDRIEIDEWSGFVLETSEAGPRARGRALLARAICRPDEAEAAAREAEAIAVQLDDAELRSYALYMLADVALAVADYDRACKTVAERLAILPRIHDPDHRADAHWAALPAYLGSGRFADARRIAFLHDDLTARLSPHHRLHGVAVLLEVEQLAGNWPRIRELTPRAEQATEQTTTRCLHNRLALLTCALASAYLGDDEEARRLEARSEESGVELYGRAESLVWLALHRGNLDALAPLLDELERPRRSLLRTRKLAPVAARLDALAALGHRRAVEEAAPALLRPGTYLEPFALRALGHVRGDARLTERATARFDELGLDWHARQTEAAARLRQH